MTNLESTRQESDLNPARGHAIGWLCMGWGIVAWIEWFVVATYIPDDGSPVPHLAFAPGLLTLILGSLVAVCSLPITAWRLRRWNLLSYGTPAFSYLAFHVWRII